MTSIHDDRASPSDRLPPSQLNGKGVEGTRALVVCPVSAQWQSGEGRDDAARLSEICSLAEAIGLELRAAEVVTYRKMLPGTFLGSGALERFRVLIDDEAIEVAVVDHALTPVQQRNLERAWNCKVIDRTGLILEIFGARAKTREGQLQVELAALSYQRSRLVRSWTHLERQRGGAGFMGGPGERQIELDRRLIDQRIVKIKRQLKDVQRTRGLHRAARQKVPYATVALVGYTNAGKSTLFNRLTQAEVIARDQLFATLDPTMRRLALPSGRQIILSDTVGFISEIPTDLIAAFRATLEEVVSADLIVHVRDIASPDTEAQASDVLATIKHLKGEFQDEEEILEVWNKVDLLTAEQRRDLRNLEERQGAVAISAVEGEGIEALLAAVDRRLGRERRILELTVDASDGHLLAWLYRHGEVLERSDEDTVCRLTVSLDALERGRLDRLLDERPGSSLSH